MRPVRQRGGMTRQVQIAKHGGIAGLRCLSHPPSPRVWPPSPVYTRHRGPRLIRGPPPTSAPSPTEPSAHNNFPARVDAFINQVMGLQLGPAHVAGGPGSPNRRLGGRLQLRAPSARGHTNTGAAASSGEVAAIVEAFTGRHRFVVDYLLEESWPPNPSKCAPFSSTRRSSSSPLAACATRSPAAATANNCSRDWSATTCSAPHSTTSDSGTATTTSSPKRNALGQPRRRAGPALAPPLETTSRGRITNPVTSSCDVASPARLLTSTTSPDTRSGTGTRSSS